MRKFRVVQVRHGREVTRMVTPLGLALAWACWLAFLPVAILALVLVLAVDATTALIRLATHEAAM